MRICGSFVVYILNLYWKWSISMEHHDTTYQTTFKCGLFLWIIRMYVSVKKLIILVPKLIEAQANDNICSMTDELFSGSPSRGNDYASFHLTILHLCCVIKTQSFVYSRHDGTPSFTYLLWTERQILCTCIINTFGQTIKHVTNFIRVQYYY